MHLTCALKALSPHPERIQGTRGRRPCSGRTSQKERVWRAFGTGVGANIRAQGENTGAKARGWRPLTGVGCPKATSMASPKDGPSSSLPVPLLCHLTLEFLPHRRAFPFPCNMFSDNRMRQKLWCSSSPPRSRESASVAMTKTAYWVTSTTEVYFSQC